MSELDALRGIAACMVMLYHYTFRFNNKFHAGLDVPFVFSKGFYGVECFFVISGFVIFMTLEKCDRGTDFVISRAARLYPTYWVCLAITVLVLKLFPLLVAPPSTHQVLLNITMLQTYLHVEPIDGAYWTLAVELDFYALIFLVFLLGKLRHVENIGLGFLVFSAGINWLYIHYPEMGWINSVKILMLRDYANLFFAGIIFYNIFIHGFTIKRVLLLATCLLYELLLQNVESNMVIWIVFGIFILFVTGNLKYISNGFLLFLGTISYSLYLVHQEVGYIILKCFLLNNINNKWLILVPVAVSVLIATAISFLIERPIVKVVKKWYAAVKVKPTIQAIV